MFNPKFIKVVNILEMIAQNCNKKAAQPTALARRDALKISLADPPIRRLQICPRNCAAAGLVAGRHCAGCTVAAPRPDSAAPLRLPRAARAAAAEPKRLLWFG